MVSRNLCPSRSNTGGTYGYPYYFNRDKVLTSRPTLVWRLLLLPWYVLVLVCVGVSVMLVDVMWPGEGMWEVQRHHCMRIWGDTPIKGPSAFIPGPFMRHQGTCSRSSGRDTAPPPPNTLSGIGCVVFSVAVNVLCRVCVCVPPPPFSSGLGTGNGGVKFFQVFTTHDTLE